MKQNEEKSQKAQKLTQEELENVNGGGGPGGRGKRKFEPWHMRDGSFCVLLVAAAEPSNTERTVLSVCDSHGSDFGCLSHVVQKKISKNQHGPLMIGQTGPL